MIKSGPKKILGDISELLASDEIFSEEYQVIAVPSDKHIHELIHKCRIVLFPGYFENIVPKFISLNAYVEGIVNEIYELLVKQITVSLLVVKKDAKDQDRKEAKSLAKCKALQFIKGLPKIRSILYTDVDSAYLSDPAAESRAEVIVSYPCMRAIINYRVAHALHNLDIPLIPRIITEKAHSETGIDIHPEAKIGHHFTIDHGTGVVIGSTCIVGNHVKLYQGVTLGAKSFPLDENGNPIKGVPRHPILEDNVIVYCNATLLGRITIGKNSVVGGNVWVTKSVDPNTKIIQTSPKYVEYIDGGGI